MRGNIIQAGTPKISQTILERCSCNLDDVETWRDIKPEMTNSQRNRARPLVNPVSFPRTW